MRAEEACSKLYEKSEERVEKELDLCVKAINQAIENLKPVANLDFEICHATKTTLEDEFGYSVSFYNKKTEIEFA